MLSSLIYQRGLTNERFTGARDRKVKFGRLKVITSLDSGFTKSTLGLQNAAEKRMEQEWQLTAAKTQLEGSNENLNDM
jgi:hypothetical protein